MAAVGLAWTESYEEAMWQGEIRKDEEVGVQARESLLGHGKGSV